MDEPHKANFSDFKLKPSEELPKPPAEEIFIKRPGDHIHYWFNHETGNASIKIEGSDGSMKGAAVHLASG